MPNYVYQMLKFSYHGEENRIQEIKEFLQNGERVLCFEKVIAPPDDDAYRDLPDQKTAKLSPNWWYEWNRENWGTKWNALEPTLVSEGDWKLVYSFQTAWNAPIPIIDAILERFHDVDINYIAADDGGFFAYHIISNSEDDSTQRHEFKGGDNVSRAAIYEALNTSY